MRRFAREVSADYYTHTHGIVSPLTLTITYIHREGQQQPYIAKLVQDHRYGNQWVGAGVEIGNSMPKAGIKPKSLAFRAMYYIICLVQGYSRFFGGKSPLCGFSELSKTYYSKYVIDYGRSDRRLNQGHRDFDRNSRSQIDKYTCCVQNDCTQMHRLL